MRSSITELPPRDSTRCGCNNKSRLFLTIGRVVADELNPRHPPPFAAEVEAVIREFHDKNDPNTTQFTGDASKEAVRIAILGGLSAKQAKALVKQLARKVRGVVIQP